MDHLYVNDIFNLILSKIIINFSFIICNHLLTSFHFILIIFIFYHYHNLNLINFNQLLYLYYDNIFHNQYFTIHLYISIFIIKFYFFTSFFYSGTSIRHDAGPSNSIVVSHLHIRRFANYIAIFLSHYI